MRKIAFVALMSFAYFGFLFVFLWEVTTPLSATVVHINQGDKCFRCERTIVRTRLAGEIVDKDGIAYKFRQPACMAQYVNESPKAPGPWREVLVTDYTSGLMVPVERAFFVAAAIDWTGERDYLAFNSRVVADMYARELITPVVDWSAVMAEGARRAQLARATAD